MELDPNDKPLPTIKVVDRRRFTAEGAVRPDAGPLSEKPRAAPRPLVDPRGTPPGAGAPRGGRAAAPGRDARGGQRPQPAVSRDPREPRHARDPAAGFGGAAFDGPAGPAGDVDANHAAESGDANEPRLEFLPFIATLATNAMAALGMLPDGERQGIPRSPQMAREYIDIIVMLEQRTRGNLTDEEAATLSRLINDLRVQYVELTRSVQPATMAPPVPPHMR